MNLLWVKFQMERVACGYLTIPASAGLTGRTGRIYNIYVVCMKFCGLTSNILGCCVIY
jgi:hypothetical protein